MTCQIMYIYVAVSGKTSLIASLPNIDKYQFQLFRDLECSSSPMVEAIQAKFYNS